MRSTSALLALLGIASAAAWDTSSAGSSCGSSSDSSSNSDGSSWSSGSDGDELRMRVQAGLLQMAAEPFTRPKIRYAIGPQRFSIDRIQREFQSTHSCKARFRFDLNGLRRLKQALAFPDEARVVPTPPAPSLPPALARAVSRCPPTVQLGAQVRTKSRHLATGEEALLILLARLAYPCTWGTMAWEAGRSPGALSEIFHWSIDHVFETHAHLRDSRSLECWAGSFSRFAAAVQGGGRRTRRGKLRRAPLTNCVLLVDGTYITIVYI